LLSHLIAVCEFTAQLVNFGTKLLLLRLQRLQQRQQRQQRQQQLQRLQNDSTNANGSDMRWYLTTRLKKVHEEERGSNQWKKKNNLAMSAGLQPAMVRYDLLHRGALAVRPQHLSCLLERRVLLTPSMTRATTAHSCDLKLPSSCPRMVEGRVYCRTLARNISAKTLCGIQPRKRELYVRRWVFLRRREAVGRTQLPAFAERLVSTMLAEQSLNKRGWEELIKAARSHKPLRSLPTSSKTHLK